MLELVDGRNLSTSDQLITCQVKQHFNYSIYRLRLLLEKILFRLGRLAEWIIGGRQVAAKCAAAVVGHRGFDQIVQVNEGGILAEERLWRSAEQGRSGLMRR